MYGKLYGVSSSLSRPQQQRHAGTLYETKFSLYFEFKRPLNQDLLMGYV